VRDEMLRHREAEAGNAAGDDGAGVGELHGTSWEGVETAGFYPSTAFRLETGGQAPARFRAGLGRCGRPRELVVRNQLGQQLLHGGDVVLHGRRNGYHSDEGRFPLVRGVELLVVDLLPVTDDSETGTDAGLAHADAGAVEFVAGQDTT